jgi:hypothetical protein
MVKAEMAIKWHRAGYEAKEIARLLGIGEDECRSIILHPELVENRPETEARTLI